MSNNAFIKYVHPKTYDTAWINGFEYLLIIVLLLNTQVHTILECFSEKDK